MRTLRRSAAAGLPVFLALVAPVAAQAPASEAGNHAAAFTMQDVFDTKNVTVADVSEDGRWVVITATSLRDRIGADNYRYGDPTYLGTGVAEIRIVDTRTGDSRPLLDAKRQARSFAWSPDAARLAFLLRDGDWYHLAIWERSSGTLSRPALPAGTIVAENATLQWTRDGSGLLVPLRTETWRTEAQRRFEQEVRGPIVVRSSSDPFLSWESIRRLSNQQSLVLYEVGSAQFREVLPESALGSFRMTADGSALRIEEDVTEKTSYEEIFGREHRLVARPLDGGEPRVLMESTKGVRAQWSGDGRSYAWSKDGGLFYATIDGGEPRRLAVSEAADSAAAPADSAAARERRERDRFTPVRLSYDGAALIARNAEGFWFFDTAAGTRERFHDAPQDEDDEDDSSPRWEVVEWSRDGDEVYLSYASRTAWERGLYRYDRSSKRLVELLKDDRMYSGFQLSADGSTVVLGIAEGNRPADVYAGDADLRQLRRLTDANPGLGEKLGRTELIDYLDVDGKTLHGVLYYPLDYRAGQRYPTVFIVYETFFDDRFNSTVALLTSNGYAVVQPSVNLVRGHPGEAWMKGVTAAANEVIAMGVADPDELGVHGTSYGGYATNLLVTQTDRFAAAINISGKVDMISFYTDSPRLGVRNIHAPERSQDRIGATLWEQPHKYIAHSAIMFADRIRTPLLLMTGQQDHNVPERTTMEMFYALRRLGREVEWVSYIDGGHGMPTSTEAEVIDYHERILGWYARYLKGGAGKRVAEESRE